MGKIVVAGEAGMDRGMRLQRTLAGLIGVCALLLLARPAAADVASCSTPAGAISCTGSLNSPEDIFTETFTLAATSTITVQTYGFGGGTNAAGTMIPSGGFDPLVALFSGTATSATVLMSGGNAIADADSFSTYSNSGCPPAGEITVGSVPNNCGDDKLTATLGSGTYTLLLTDANFLPIPVNPGIGGPVDLTDTTSNNYGSSTMTGAYTDATAGVFQTCVTLTDCNTDTANFAVDILEAPAAVPEPATLGFLSFVLAALMSRGLWMRGRGNPPSKEL